MSLVDRIKECPGFIGVDTGDINRVVIEPAYVMDALRWLKRRFVVNENLDLSMDQGLVLEVIPRQPRRNGQRRRITFAKPVQYELNLAVTAT